MMRHSLILDVLALQGVPLEALAEHLGVKPRMVHRWIEAERTGRLRLGTLRRVLAALDHEPVTLAVRLPTWDRAVAAEAKAAAAFRQTESDMALSSKRWSEEYVEARRHDAATRAYLRL